MSNLRKEEVFIMNWAGKILEALGWSGMIFTLFFDQIARGTEIRMDWLQFTGMVVFAGIALFGVAVDRFLQTVKTLLDN